MLPTTTNNVATAAATVYSERRRTTQMSALHYPAWTTRARLYAAVLVGAFVAYTYSHTVVVQYLKKDNGNSLLHLGFDTLQLKTLPNTTTTAATTTTASPTVPIVDSRKQAIPPPPPPPLLPRNETERRSRVVYSNSRQGGPDDDDKNNNDAPSIRVMADFIYNGQTGSYWLPRPPMLPVNGYDLRENNSNTTSRARRIYGNRTGFVAHDHVNIVMYDGVWHANFDGYNAGDFIAYFLSPLIAGRPPLMTGLDKGLTRQAARGGLAVVGSILHFGPRYSWGPGMIEYPQYLRMKDGTTERIFAMRGPKSYRQMKRQYPQDGVIPNVVGDIGSFMSWFYQPHDQVKRYELCIIPHYIDKNAPFITRLQNTMTNNESLAILDISGPITALMDDIVKCKFVLSSSLHGIIFSDSYSIPNAHVELSTKVFGKGHKFDDYYESVNRTRHVLNGRADIYGKAEPGNNMTVAQVLEWVQEQRDFYQRQPPRLDHLLAFWNACPMHGVAYHGQTRHDQEYFGQRWAANLDYYMHHRPATMLQLEMAMNRALNVSLPLEFDPKPKLRRHVRRRLRRRQ